MGANKQACLNHNTTSLVKDSQWENHLFHDLSQIKHKWLDNTTANDIIQEYPIVPEIIGPGDQLHYGQRYITINRDCSNKMLFDTLLKLSGLLYLKYNFSRGMIVKVRINTDEIFHEDQDVVIQKDEFGSKSLGLTGCLIKI